MQRYWIACTSFCSIGNTPTSRRIVGLDANYAEDVERSPVWSDLLEYPDDGIRF